MEILVVCVIDKAIDGMKLYDDVNVRSLKFFLKRLNKRVSKRYWIVYFYNFEEVIFKLIGFSVANCNFILEYVAVLEIKDVGKLVLGGTYCYNLYVYC